MVNHIVIPTQGRIFILDGVEAMGTRGDDLFDLVGIHHLDVLHGLHLKEEFVAGAFGGISSTTFFWPKHCIVNPDGFQDLNQRLDYSLIAVVIGASTANPKQVFLNRLFDEENLAQEERNELLTAFDELLDLKQEKEALETS